MAIKVGINGFGRIGRLVFRAAAANPEIEVVGVNDPFIDLDYMVYMLRYDTVHGQFKGDISIKDGKLVVNGEETAVYAFMNASEIPWKDCGAEYVVESTGINTTIDKASAHFVGGAKKVVISAPSSDAPMFVMGVNQDKYTKDMNVVSNASCTTNCLAPVAKVLNDAIGIDKGFMTTIHAYTGDQPTLDTMHKDLYRARAAALSMIPTSTGAAKALGLVLPDLKGKLDGSSIRVPTPNVSVVDLKVVAGREVTVEEINAALQAAADGPMKGVLFTTTDPLVSHDLNHIAASSTAALPQTQVVDGKLARVLSWYDNEWGFSTRMSDTALAMAKLI